MRDADERRAWRALASATASLGRPVLALEAGVEVDLSRGCTVLAGRNGAGKSQVLRSAKQSLGDSGVLIELHRLCEQVLRVLRSRTDIEDMEEETGALVISDDVVDHVRRVVGRDYDLISWYALEMEPDLGDENHFFWWPAQPVVPHFRVAHHGVEYSTLDMGLGELSVHLLFWILEQYREEPDLTLLLDEPDAFLPPVGSEHVLARLQAVCRSRRWGLVVSTHSEEMIRCARENDGLVVLRREGTTIGSSQSWIDGSDIADHLLAASPVELVLFCEDESAASLARASLRARDELTGVDVVWAGGTGHLLPLVDHLPTHPRMPVRFGVVLDGDQRRAPDWAGRDLARVAFLPTDEDPDSLFSTLRNSPENLALRLQVPIRTLTAWLDALEGSDPHDWVNGLAAKCGARDGVLAGLADLWVAEHDEAVEEFVVDVRRIRSS